MVNVKVFILGGWGGGVGWGGGSVNNNCGPKTVNLQHFNHAS